MDRYSIYLRKEVFDLLTGVGKADRDRILRFLGSLEEDPFQKGDYELLDEDRRTHFVRIVGNLAVVYWVDHAVREVKIIAMRHADR